MICPRCKSNRVRKRNNNPECVDCGFAWDLSGPVHRQATDREAYEQRYRRYGSMPHELHRAAHSTPACEKYAHQYVNGEIGYLEMVESMAVALQQQNERLMQLMPVASASEAIRMVENENQEKEIETGKENQTQSTEGA